jgi:hypothetical protein
LVPLPTILPTVLPTNRSNLRVPCRR